MRHLARAFRAPALAFFLAVALAPEARAAATPAPLWTSVHQIIGTDGLIASPVATRMLADGSVMIALGNGTNTGVMTVRYDAAGTELSHADVSPPHRKFVALDPFGALYVFGTSPANGTEFWVMKYDGISGHALWPAPAEVHNPGSNFHNAFAVAVDPHGDVVALGQVGSAPSFDWATFKLDGRNGATLWGPVTFDGASHGSDTPVALAIDAAGNVAVTGASSNGSNDDFATMKYNGTTGAVVWGPRLYNSPANATDTPVAVAFDPSGNVVVTGRSIDPPNSSYDVTTFKYDGATGATLWGPAVLKPSSGGQDIVQAMAVDPRGNVIVTASAFAGSDFDWATVKYDSQTGAVAWGPVFYGSSPTDVPVAIVADAHGDVFIAGRKSNGGASSIDTLSYDGRTGAVRWGPNAFDLASSQPLPYGLLLDASGDVVWTATLGPPNRLVTLKYSATTGATVWISYRTGDAGRSTSPAAMTTAASGDVFTADWAQDVFGNVVTEVRRLPAQTGEFGWSIQAYDLRARSIATDAAGNPVVVFSHVGAGGWVDTQTIKYSGATGAPIWTAIFAQNGTFDDTPHAVDVDGNGDVLVGGTAGAGALANVFTLKYAGATGAPVWGPTLSASIPNVGVQVFLQKIDSAGNVVYLTDGLQGTTLIVDSFLTAKISGSTGAVVWGPNDFIDSGGFAFPSGLALDASGNVFVSGHGYDGSAIDLVVLKYAAATGATLWGPVRYHAATSGARPLVAVDSSGDVFLSGYLSGPTFSIATLKYNGATGALLWGPSLVANASVGAIAVNGAGDVVVAGRRDNATPDFLLVQYAGPDGSVVWGPVVTDSGQDDRIASMRLVGNDPVVYGGIDHSVTVRFSTALTITNPPGDLPAAACGVPYAGSLSAQNGSGGLTWTFVSGALPDGIFLGASGAFSGTPTAPGTSYFRARVTDGAAAFAERDFYITVAGHDTYVAVAAAPDPTCPGEPVTLSVPGTWSSYLWLRGGETTPTIQVSPHATAEYGVLLGDGTGCVTHGVGRVDVRDPAFGTAAAITSISPASGLAAGSVSVALSGSDFASGATAAVGGVAAGSVSATTCLAAHLSTPSLPPGTLNDVAWTNPGAAASTLANAFFADFLDVPQGHLFHSFVEKLVRHAVAAGCGSGAYCVGTPVTRGQIAVFLLRSNDGPTYVPPPCTTPPFADVPCSNPFSRWIQELSARGVTAGCAPGSYCPNSPVTRGQMAVFLLRTKDGLGYTPPPCATPPFADVPCSSGFAIWIQELVHRGITAGCGGGDYCPGDPVTRGQMAVFLATTFALS